MEITSFGVGFFFYLFVAVVASGIASTVVEVIARGDGGKITYVVSFLVTLVFVFLAYHWDVIGVWTPDEWIRKSAVASVIVTALFVSAVCSSIGKSVGTALTTPAWLKDDEQAAKLLVEAVARMADVQTAIETVGRPRRGRPRPPHESRAAGGRTQTRQEGPRGR